MSHQPQNRVRILLEQFNHSLGLPFQDLLPASEIKSLLEEEKITYRDRLFSPLVTVWAFLSQVIDFDKTCHHAVSRIIFWLAGQGQKLPSEDPSGYSQARQRLPESFVRKLFSRVGETLETGVAAEQLWRGHPVKLFDGSSVSMPDTPQNQAVYPQPKSQQLGCGFPLAKIGVLFSLTTGAVLAFVIDQCEVHDLKLMRQLYEWLQPGDVLVGDRAICAYADLYAVKQRGAEAVVRKHGSRWTRKRKGKRVGSSDQIVVWKKPRSCPKGLSAEAFATLPPTLTVREIHYLIKIPGWRTKQVTVITTLLDAAAYPAVDVVELYGLRWEVELDLRHLKTTLGMDILRSKTPEMVRKEICMYLLAYNLLRTLMWQAGLKMKVNPLRLSLQGARHHLHNFVTEAKACCHTQRQRLYQNLLELIAQHPLKKRVARYEPRVKKRRPKSYPFMQESRATLRQKVA